MILFGFKIDKIAKMRNLKKCDKNELKTVTSATKIYSLKTFIKNAN